MQDNDVMIEMPRYIHRLAAIYAMRNNVSLENFLQSAIAFHVAQEKIVDFWDCYASTR